MFKKVVLLSLIFLFLSCKQESKLIVVNSQNTEKYLKIKELALDKNYPNLLNPQYSTESDYKEVIATWQDFHQQIGKIVKQNNFDWEVKDSTILVFNKIYFDKDGNVDYFTFKIGNKNISEAKKDEYEKLLSDNISKVKINLHRDKQYAQCGKVKYSNK